MFGQLLFNFINLGTDMDTLLKKFSKVPFGKFLNGWQISKIRRSSLQITHSTNIKFQKSDSKINKNSKVSSKFSHK